MNNSTGMMAGQRYSIGNVTGAQEFPGFFLDGKYFLHPELLTSVGWLDGDRFIYDQLSSTGEPVFEGGVAGTIKDLTLTLVDGTPLSLTELEFAAQRDEPAEHKVAIANEGNLEKRIANPAFLLATASITILIGYAVGRLSGTRRGDRQIRNQN